MTWAMVVGGERGSSGDLGERVGAAPGLSWEGEEVTKHYAYTSPSLSSSRWRPGLARAFAIAASSACNCGFVRNSPVTSGISVKTVAFLCGPTEYDGKGVARR